MTPRRPAVSPSPICVLVTNQSRAHTTSDKADFVACHNPSYVTKGYKMVRDVKPGGVFLINCQWTPEELNEHMPADAKRYIAKNNIQLYTINAIDKAIEIGLGKRTNTILAGCVLCTGWRTAERRCYHLHEGCSYPQLLQEG